MYDFRGSFRALALAAPIAAVALVGLGSGARAQGLFGDGQSVDLSVGGVVVVKPAFEGSKKYNVIGIPFILPGGPETDQSRFKVKGADDFRFRLLNLQNLELGALGGWRFGRQEDDSDRLIGLGDVDGGLVVGGYAAYHLGPVSPFVSYHHQVTGSETGGVLRFGAETGIQIAPSIKLTGMAGASWADDSYMTSFFGVSAAQSTASGLTAFDAHAGIKDAFVQVGTEFQFDQAWKLKLSARYTRLVGDAESSPITETADQFTGMATLSYDFRLPLP